MIRYTSTEIKAERLKRKWTQREFADMVGVTPVAVSKWENDQSEPSYNHMMRLREIFTRGAPDPDRLGEMEAQITALRQQISDLENSVLQLGRDAREFRAVVTELLSIGVEPAEAAEPQSDSQAGE